MGFKNSAYLFEQINKKLTDHGLLISMAEHKIKKSAGVFNNIIREVLEENKDSDVQLYTIIISLHEYFEMDWLVENVLDKKNKTQLENELQSDFNVKKPKKKQ